MSVPDAATIQSFVVNYLSARDPAGSLDESRINRQSFDILDAGIIDSMGVLELIGAIEEHFGITIDFEDMDPESFTVLGPFSQYIANNGVPRGT